MNNSPFKINTNIPIWSVIIGVIAMAVMWGTLSTQTNANTVAIKEIQDSQQNISSTLTDLRISQRGLEASVAGFGSNINFIKQKLQ